MMAAENLDWLNTAAAAAVGVMAKGALNFSALMTNIDCPRDNYNYYDPPQLLLLFSEFSICLHHMWVVFRPLRLPLLPAPF